MFLLKAIARFFDLSVVRARSTVRAAVFYFVFVGSVTALKSATNALFLARRDPAQLPWLYVFTAAMVTLVTIFIGRRLGVVSAKHVLRRSLAIWAAVLLVLALLSTLDIRFAPAMLYVASEAFATSLSVLFWARLGEVFDVRAAKRVFGAIAAAGMAGAVVGGLVVMLLVRVDVPSVVLCFLAPLLVLGTRPLLGGSGTPGSVRRERITFADGLGYAAGNRFPLSVAALVLLFAVHAAAIDFVFRTGTHRFDNGDEASMAATFGVLNAVAGMFSIAFQSALTARLLKRLGVFAYLSIVPALSIVVALWTLFVPNVFWPLFAMKVLEMMGSYSLNSTGLQLLYNPMPTSVRGSVRAVIDGAVKKLGGAVGGIVLIVAGGLLATADMIGLVIGLGSVLLFWIAFLRPQYLHALELKLGDRGVGPIPAIDPGEKSTRALLIRALSADDASKTLAAISVLDHDPDFDFRRHIGTLIAHSAEAVRLKAVDLIAMHPSDDYVPFLVSIIEAADRYPKAQAARALVLIDPVMARRVLEPVLVDGSSGGDRSLLSAAIAAFLGNARTAEGEGGVSHLARRALEDMLEGRADRPGSERRELVRLLGMLGPSAYAHRLREFLEDPIPAVRAAAVEAAGRARDPLLVEPLLKLLADRVLAHPVRDALAAYGDEVVPELARFLDDRRIEVSARVHVPAIMRRVGTSRAASAMLFSNRHDDAYLRHVIIEELGRMRRRDPQLKFDREQAQGAALRRLRAFTHYRPFAADVAAAGAGYEVLARGLQNRLTQNLQAGLRLLGLLYDLKAMESAFFGLQNGQHGDAVELVDVALGRSEIRDEVVTHIESRSPLPDASRASERALSLVDGRDVLLAMIASETLRRLGQSPPLVREPTSGEPLMPSSLVERIFLLQSVQFFRGLSVDDLAAVSSMCTEGHAEPREIIYAEGELGEAMYVIISGGIQLLAGSEPLLDLNAGDCFGQTSILDGGARPVTAKAGDEGVDFMRLERQPLLDLMADRPQLMNGLFAELGTRIRELVALARTSPTVEPHESNSDHRAGQAAARS